MFAAAILEIQEHITTNIPAHLQSNPIKARTSRGFLNYFHFFWYALTDKRPPYITFPHTHEGATVVALLWRPCDGATKDFIIQEEDRVEVGKCGAVALNIRLRPYVRKIKGKKAVDPAHMCLSSMRPWKYSRRSKKGRAPLYGKTPVRCAVERSTQKV